jgi:hypothetical protein
MVLGLDWPGHWLFFCRLSKFSCFAISILHIQAKSTEPQVAIQDFSFGIPKDLPMPELVKRCIQVLEAIKEVFHLF